jgi:hypothetical protein
VQSSLILLQFGILIDRFHTHDIEIDSEPEASIHECWCCCERPCVFNERRDVGSRANRQQMSDHHYKYDQTAVQNYQSDQRICSSDERAIILNLVMLINQSRPTLVFDLDRLMSLFHSQMCYSASEISSANAPGCRIMLVESIEYQGTVLKNAVVGKDSDDSLKNTR